VLHSQQRPLLPKLFWLEATSLGVLGFRSRPSSNGPESALSRGGIGDRIVSAGMITIVIDLKQLIV